MFVTQRKLYDAAKTGTLADIEELIKQGAFVRAVVSSVAQGYRISSVIGANFSLTSYDPSR
jgi:hypothetical protein